MRIVSTLTLCFLFLFNAYGQKVPLPPQVEEASAMVKIDEELHWVNVSGSDLIFYITDLDGQLIDSFSYDQLENTDVEDMTRDDRGHVFVADIGNDLHNRKDLKIHKFDRDRNYLGATQFKYPNQQLFPPAASSRYYNAEAIAYYDSNIHLFTKPDHETAGFITHHYIVPVMPGTFTVRLMESMVLPERIVTSASVSPDGQYLALLGYNFKKVLGLFPKSETSIFVFPITDKNYFFDQPYTEYEVRSKSSTRYESMEWLDNKRVIVGAKKTNRHNAHFQIVTLEE